jgi:hypothetical protein
MSRKWGFLLTAIFSYFAISGSASALTTVYTSRAAFNAATLNQQIINFNSLTAPNTATQYNSPVNTLTTGGVTFSENGPSGSLYVIDTGYPSGPGGPYFFNGGGGPYLNNNTYYTGSNQLTTLTAQLPSNISAVGSDFGLQSAGAPTTKITIGLSTGEQFVFDPLPVSPTFNFLGFVSDQTLTSLTFQATSSVPAQNSTGSPSLDNFTIGQAAPEPSAVFLAIGAFGIVSSAWRRRRQS